VVQAQEGHLSHISKVTLFEFLQKTARAGLAEEQDGQEWCL
jgi:hypothetical protein